MSGLILNPYRFTAAGLTSLSFVNGDSSQDSSIDMPSGAQVGDIAVFFELALSTSSITAAVPSGWTQVVTSQVSYSGLYVRNTISYKVLESGDLSVSLSAMSGSQSYYRNIVYVFRGDEAITSASAVDVEEEATNGDPDPQTIAAQTAPYLAFGLGTSASTSATFTQTPPFDHTDEVSGGYEGGYSIINSSPFSIEVDANDPLYRNILQSFALIPSV